MTFFGGNPFSTVVGQKIEQATDGALASENWALNMEICDIINETEEGSKDAMKAIRKRLTQNAGKNYTVVMYALTVLETCVKNCGRNFHLLATSKEFIQELVKLIGPKNDPPTAVQEKVLSLIQSWADAFKGNPDMIGVVQVYQDLRQKGVEFPMTDLDAMAPIHTPLRSIPESEICLIQRPQTHSHQQQRGMACPMTVSINLTSEQLGKLRAELDIVQSNMRIFSEMLSTLVPGQEHPSDVDLLQELNKTCQLMQTRIVELIDRVANEEVTNELLRINDEMNNLFLRYSRFEKNRPAPQAVPSELQSKPAKDLIDLGENDGKEDVHLRLASLNMNEGNATSALDQIATVPVRHGQATEDEFDMFAQSRNVSYEKNKESGSSYEDNSRVDQSARPLGAMATNRNAKPSSDDLSDEMLHSEKDYDEMEAWLKGQGSDPNARAQQQSITSSEFDSFLAERAAAQPAAAASESTARGRRQLEKDETENTLFAL